LCFYVIKKMIFYENVSSKNQCGPPIGTIFQSRPTIPAEFETPDRPTVSALTV